MDFDTLAARALNASRTIHKPTYAGLRILLSSAVRNQAAFMAFLERRIRTRECWRFFSFQIVKEASKDKSPSYRNCITGSPLTTVAESHVLSLMASQPAFRPPDCAYSYLWPQESKSGRNFEHFLEGYERRNRRVGKLLYHHPDHVALVTDIKAFYPSVSKDRLLKEVAQRVGKVLDKAVAESIRQFLTGLLERKSPGIPIGPDVSHALGHIALTPVDAAMQAKFGDRYLRYVDDIIVVCPKSAVTTANLVLQQALGKEGLILNEGKQDEVDRDTWHREVVSFTKADNISFDSLLQEITLFLLHNPDRAESLHQQLREEGFSLPISRLCSLARSKRYRAHIFRRFGDLFSWWLWAKSWFLTEQSLIKKTQALRYNLLHLAERLSQSETPRRPMLRRWFVQKRRYIFNRLLYLLPPSDYFRLLPLLPDIDEFVENRLVLQALMAGDVTQLLKYPGRVMTAFCQLWPEHHGETLPQVRWPESPDRAEAASAAHLALHLSMSPPEDFLGRLEKFPGSCILIDLCSQGTSNRKIDRLAFLDEMSLMFNGVSHDELAQMLTSRFDELEDIGLDGLLLGGPSYFFPWDVGDY